MAVTDADLFENLRLELRRGCLVLAVLAKLRAEYHGYALRKALAGSGLEIDENTLYPLLRRLESQNLLVSQWRVEDKRNKRFYRLSPAGEAVLERLLVEWRGMNESIGRLLEGARHESRPAGAIHPRSEDPVAVEQER
jgi:PadR family transcriptional regulator PadR